MYIMLNFCLTLTLIDFDIEKEKHEKPYIMQNNSKKNYKKKLRSFSFISSYYFLVHP